MRTEEEWNKIKHRYLNKFPLRVQNDLQKLKLKSVKRPQESMFIYGEVCTGKTIFAAQIMLEELKHVYLKGMIGKHNSTIFVSFPEMLAEIKSSYGGAIKTDDIMGKYLKAHLLVLDDFLSSRPTDWVLEILYYLINYRYENMALTVITSNYSLHELENILQEQRITSRISRSYNIIEKIHY
jgi:DNA replication protein DnaC